MVDFNQSLSANAAIQRVRMLDDEGVYWIEEPSMPSSPKTPLVCVLITLFLVACESSDPPEIALNDPINDEPENTQITVLSGNTPYVKTGVNGELWSATKSARINLETGELKYIST